MSYEISKPFTVAALGGESPLSQIARIREGFRTLPRVTVVDNLTDADLLYVNDPGYYNVVLAAKAAGTLKPGARCVFNVLDVPVMLFPPAGDFTYEKLATLGSQLSQADAITSISRYTQSQIQHFFGLGSTVVYNPVKPVSPDIRLSGVRPYPFRVLMVGRVNDLNKRQRTLGIPALILAGFEENEVAVCGGEYPGWGTNLGVVSDETLNDLYNSVDYVMFPSVLEGLGLPAFESLICGAIPLVCHDLTTIHELPMPQFWASYPSPQAIAYRLHIHRSNPQVFEADKQYCLSVSEGVAEQLSAANVARRIVGVYDRLVNEEKTL